MGWCGLVGWRGRGRGAISEGMTYLAAPIGVREAGDLAAALAQARAGGAEMIELRLDYLAHPSAEECRVMVAEAKRTGLPVVATCRAAGEGGRFAGSEEEREDLLEAVLGAEPDYVDVELATWGRWSDARRRRWAARPRQLILSSHDFAGLPGDLGERVRALCATPAAVVKVAYTAQSLEEAFAALDVLHEGAGGKGLAALAMGEAGSITRLLAKKLGAFLTFASLERGAESAPGQGTLAEMRGVYRWEAVGPQTRVLGVIGRPVGHSLSPALHNAAFAATGYDGIYLPLDVGAGYEHFRAAVEGLRGRPWLHVRGLSVTLPHKENALRWLEEAGGTVEAPARRIGAVNTIVFESDGGVRGYNTDYAGALEALGEKLPGGRAGLGGMSAAVIGAGGVARAIVAGLVDAGAVVTVFNRTAERARQLAGEFGCRALPLEELGRQEARLLVNATSVGMHPKAEAAAVDSCCLRPGMMVFDTVYNPARTRLLREAEEAGATVVDGVSMFVNQAAGQFERFTGRAAPKDLMRRVVEGLLREGAGGAARES